MYIGREAVVGNRNFAFALEALVHEDEVLPLPNVNFSREISNTNSRALQVAEDRHRLRHLVGKPAKRLDSFRVLGVSAVREVEAGDTHARFHQPSYSFFSRARRPKRADDLGARNEGFAHFAALSWLIFRSIPAVSESNDFWKLARPSTSSLSVTSRIDIPTASSSRRTPSAAPSFLSTVR